MANIPMDTRDLAKKALAERIQNLLWERGWNQSDLANAAFGGSRELVSTYIRAKAFPSPLKLKQMSDAFGFSSVDEFLPAHKVLAAHDDFSSALDIKQAVGNSNMFWLRVNRMVSFKTLVGIVELLEKDTAATQEAKDREAAAKPRA